MAPPGRRKFAVVLATLLVVAFTLGLFLHQPSTSGYSSQNVCIGLGGWPCGYTGPFTGYYSSGYATLGCTPTTPNGTCAAPQIALQTGYLVINNTAYVIDWANQSMRFNNQLTDGSRISVSGRMEAVYYNKTPGSTYPIYYSTLKGLLKPQPLLQIGNATLTDRT